MRTLILPTTEERRVLEYMLALCSRVVRVRLPCISAPQRTALSMTTRQPPPPGEYFLVEVGQVDGFMQRCLVSAGAAEPHAASLAATLVQADMRGHFSHGLNRLEMYCSELKSGQCDGKATPKVVKETLATALVDGQNGIGPVVGEFSMDLAIAKAKDAGCAWVTATGSNHFGIAGHYTLRAVDQGLIGISVTNTSPLVVPTRAQMCALGTNPISFAAPAKNGPFVLDMSTSTAAIGKVELQARKELPIPGGWGVDSSGHETHDPQRVLQGGGLMPLGGQEATAGYKGYGLAMMVEVMCGMLGGGAYAHHIRKWSGEDHRSADLGHTFIAVDPSVFAPDFQTRLDVFMQEMRQLEPSVSGESVLVAGDPERAHEQKVSKDGGIFYHKNLLQAMEVLADKLNIEKLRTISK